MPLTTLGQKQISGSLAACCQPPAFSIKKQIADSTLRAMSAIITIANTSYTGKK